MIHADYNDDKLVWILHGPTREQEFVEIVGAIIHGNPREEGQYGQTAVCIVGRLTDKRMLILGESITDFDKAVKRLIDFKDLFELKRIFYNPDNEDYRRRILEYDGLVEYFPATGSRPERQRFRNPPDHWEHFRSRRTLATLNPVRTDLLTDYDSAFGRIGQLISKKDLIAADWTMELAQIWGREGAKGRDHPFMVALVYAAVSLYLENLDLGGSTEIETTAWYGK